MALRMNESSDIRRFRNTRKIALEYDFRYTFSGAQLSLEDRRLGRVNQPGLQFGFSNLVRHSMRSGDEHFISNSLRSGRIDGYSNCREDSHVVSLARHEGPIAPAHGRKWTAACKYRPAF
jgi:hypothetical protein